MLSWCKEYASILTCQICLNRLFCVVQINEFVKLGGEQLVPYYADILGAILPCISDKEEKIRVVSTLSDSCSTLHFFLLMPPFLF